MRLFISGPMRGIPQHNAPAFQEARDRLRGAGYDVYCPSEATIPLDTPEAITGAMTGHLEALLKCDGVVFLPGWSRSEGAKVEAAVAVSCGIDTYEYHRHRPQYLEQIKNVKVVTRVEVISG